jgi:hypothetical protein
VEAKLAPVEDPEIVMLPVSIWHLTKKRKTKCTGVLILLLKGLTMFEFGLVISTKYVGNA